MKLNLFSILIVLMGLSKSDASMDASNMENM